MVRSVSSLAAAAALLAGTVPCRVEGFAPLGVVPAFSASSSGRASSSSNRAMSMRTAVVVPTSAASASSMPLHLRSMLVQPSSSLPTTLSSSSLAPSAHSQRSASGPLAAASASVEIDVPKEKGKLMKAYLGASTWFTNLFPVWLALFSAIALKRPDAFAWFTTEYFTGGLAVLMLSMGITLSPRDFQNVLKRPNAVLVGFIFCYACMPALAYGLGLAAGLSPAMLAGLVLVGSINGGQASNLCTYIANGNVALSVMMTTVTTLGAIVMTPLLCKFLLGAVVPVDAAGIAMSTIQVVLAPIAVGMATNKFFPKAVKAVLPVTPVVGVLSTCFLVASAVAQVADTIISAGWGLQIPIILLHLVGGLGGYFLPRLMGFSETTSRTMAIETSMKSSAFGFLLAKLHFGAFDARVPAAVSVVWMAITGSLLAIVWRYIPVKRLEIDFSVKEKFDKVNFLNIFKWMQRKITGGADTVKDEASSVSSSVKEGGDGLKNSLKGGVDAVKAGTDSVKSAAKEGGDAVSDAAKDA